MTAILQSLRTMSSQRLFERLSRRENRTKLLCPGIDFYDSNCRSTVFTSLIHQQQCHFGIFLIFWHRSSDDSEISRYEISPDGTGTQTSNLEPFRGERRFDFSKRVKHASAYQRSSGLEVPLTSKHVKKPDSMREKTASHDQRIRRMNSGFAKLTFSKV
jgi:hypothetical protein